VGEFDPRTRFTESPVARLATVTPGGRPHLVPVVFALVTDPQGAEDAEDAEDVVYTAVDAKPKTTRRLRRLANIEGNPEVSLLVDHYADDWTRLWWVRVDGVATGRLRASGDGCCVRNTLSIKRFRWTVR
jgi:PPOX class probable F420-dependent enzyme